MIPSPGKIQRLYNSLIQNECPYYPFILTYKINYRIALPEVFILH